MDALSEALRGVCVTGALFLDAELRAPWGFASPAASTYAAELAPGTEHLVSFHLVSEGTATARVAGQPDLRLRAGDIVVFPRGDAHRLWNGRVRTPIDTASLLPALLAGGIAKERGGGAGATTKFICGYFGFERYAERLFLAGLPPLFKVHVRGDAAGGWIESSIRHSVSEAASGQAGRLALVSKLTEALFLETLCRYMDELPPECTGWLAGARDPIVGRALACLHRDPARDWKLADLARAVGASRTVLASRFARFLGEPPFAYLARWRLQLAARLLATSERAIVEVAQAVGYDSEPAFNRAFKRALGVPPARYRRRMRGSGAA